MSRITIRPAILAILLAACGGGDVPANGSLVVEIGGRQADRLAEFYVGSFVPSEFVDSVMSVRGSSAIIDTSALRKWDSTFAEALAAHAGQNGVSRDGLRAAVQSTYRSARDFPASVEALRSEVQYSRADSTWFWVELRGSMTRYDRVIYVPKSNLQDAILAFTRGDGLVYPVSTMIIGEHLEEGQIVETTLMKRRDDGYWDYAAYGASGLPTEHIAGEPKPLAVPTQCFGCHYGNRLFEPEKSFPGRAPDGPHGERLIRGSEGDWDPEVAALFDEHRNRSDGLLGVYASMYVSRLKSATGERPKSAREQALLEALNL